MKSFISVFLVFSILVSVSKGSLDLHKNYALNRPVKQSTTAGNGRPELAVDGVKSQEKTSCTMTQRDEKAWWQVDLGAMYDVRTVSVVANSLKNFYVLVSNEEASTLLKKPLLSDNWCTNRDATVNGEVQMQCTRYVYPGRYVIIYVYRPGSLSLCEVGVYGFKVKSGDRVNVALNQPAKQKSTSFDGPPELAVDGNLNVFNSNGHVCTQTKDEMNSWWQVDLGKQYVVKSLTIFNREDCCADRLNNFQVRISNDPDVNKMINNEPPETFCVHRSKKIPGGAQYEAFCTPSTYPGRYVTIYLTGRGILALCEVQVFGFEV